MRPYTFDAPACWASALINGDTSGLSDEDEAEFNEWCERNPDEHSEVVDAPGEPYTGRWNGLITELLEYSALSHRDES